MSCDLVTVGVVCADVMVRPVEAFPPRGRLELVPHLEMHLGGLAGVTAAVFSQLGGRAAFVGCLGQDSFGDYLESALKKCAVDTSGIRRDGSASSSATVVLISEDGERTFLHHVGTNASTTEADLDFEVIANAKVLHWGGASITPGLDGPPMGKLFEKARALGVRTAIDTCFDGKGIWLPNIAPALPHTDIVFSSLEEARQYTGRQTHEDIAAFYLDQGAALAVIKLGGDGIFVKNAAEAHLLPAHQVPVVDTTGAGDAACGGFLYGYVQGWDLKQCARLANAVGGLTVQRMGGAEAIESLEKTLEFMESLPC